MWCFFVFLGGFGVIKEGCVNIFCCDIEEVLEINLEEVEMLVVIVKDGMIKLDFKKGYIEN